MRFKQLWIALATVLLAAPVALAVSVDIDLLLKLTKKRSEIRLVLDDTKSKAVRPSRAKPAAPVETAAVPCKKGENIGLPAYLRRGHTGEPCMPGMPPKKS